MNDVMQTMQTVLVVDDEQGVRNLLHSICSSLGAKVVLASNGQEGLEHTRTTQFDIVFVDVNMPVMNGIELAQQLHKQKSQPRIVIMSATEQKSEIDLLLQRETQFLRKPFTLSTIKQLLSN